MTALVVDGSPARSYFENAILEILRVVGGGDARLRAAAGLFHPITQARIPS